MKRLSIALALVILGLSAPSSDAGLLLHRKAHQEKVLTRLHGQIIDYTNNHGQDRRIWSESLQSPRDLYVYLPPGYDPQKKYPLLIYLHGYAQDEQSFLEYLAEPLDCAMASGEFPPAIVAVPDGSLEGHACRMKVGSFFLNSKAGAFEDWVMKDMWTFLFDHYSIRREREAHVLTGVSMGGGSAFNLGIKYRDRVKIVAGVFPAVNTRYLDDRGRYMTPFDPERESVREGLRQGQQIVGRFYGVVLISLKRLTKPIYDRRDPDSINQMARENPKEMLDLYDVKPGELSLFIGYGGRDQFNIAAQVESFLYHAKERNITAEVEYLPRGKHDAETALKILPALLRWLGPQLTPYSPGGEKK